jgi:quercetin dioxygenase-like cupin family protein
MFGPILASQKLPATTAMPMAVTRIFNSAEFMQPTEGEGEPIRSVVTHSPEAVVVAWHVNPGQRIAAHLHPHGQDTWTVLSGSGEYQLEHSGRSQAIFPGCVVVAPTGCVHGVFNRGGEPLVFISVVSPAEAGYELV